MSFRCVSSIAYVCITDLKLGISEKSIFHEFHPDAEDLFNVTCDLKLVCEKLRDRGQRHKRQVSFECSLLSFYLVYFLLFCFYFYSYQ